jgi:3-oxoacyl-[acyl-carrier protein] reductase
MLLKDKNIVITGSGRGIGREIAKACAEEGANIGITSRTIEELQETKEQITNINPDVKTALKTADINDYSEVEDLFNYFHKELGLLNGVIANAGASGRYDTHKFTPEKFALIMDVNVDGVFHTFKAAYNILKKDEKKDKARFIITGSAAYPNAMPKFTAYTASKYAVVGFQRAVALEYRRENINFNTILPTMVDTQLLRGDKAGDGNAPPGVMDPKELSKYYIFLLSEHANRVNDELISVNQFEQLYDIIKETSEEKKEDWDTFKDYLEKNQQNIYDNIRKQWRLAKFLLELEK